MESIIDRDNQKPRPCFKRNQSFSKTLPIPHVTEAQKAKGRRYKVMEAKGV